MKCDLSFIVESMCMFVVSEANARVNSMGLIAEGCEHFGGFLGVFRFIEHAVIDKNDGIGGDEDFSWMGDWWCWDLCSAKKYKFPRG